jgi:hypothetical protein
MENHRALPLRVSGSGGAGISVWRPAEPGAILCVVFGRSEPMSGTGGVWAAGRLRAGICSAYDVPVVDTGFERESLGDDR